MSLQPRDLRQLLDHSASEAQRGNLAESREIVKTIRETFAIERMPDVSAEVMIVEGMCEGYSGNFEAAHDRFRRAVLVAHHFGSYPVEQLALSWLAHCEFNRGHPLESVRHIGLALRDIAKARPEARFRISSTIAVLCEYAGMTTSASEWFRIARREASKCGEPAMMSAIVFSMASLRIGSRMIARLIDSSGFNPDALDLLFVESAYNYDAVVKLNLQSDLHRLLKSQALMVCGRYEEALFVLNNLMHSGIELSSMDLARAGLSRAWCEYNLGLTITDAKKFSEFIDELVDSDDLALGHDILAQISGATGDAERSSQEMLASKRCLAEFLVVRKSISSSVVSQGIDASSTEWPDE